MVDIFLSYAREDEQRIRPLVEALEMQGWQVFWDRNIPVGQTWRDHIGQALVAARCVVVAWSRASVRSRWVTEEADDGQKRGILVPVLLDPIEPPIGFRSIQAADLTQWSPELPSHVFERLIIDVAAVLGKPRPVFSPDTAGPLRSRPVTSMTRSVFLGLFGAIAIAGAVLSAYWLYPKPTHGEFVAMAGAMDAGRWSKSAGNGGIDFIGGQLEVSTHKGFALVAAGKTDVDKDFTYSLRTDVVSGPTQLGFGLIFGMNDTQNYFWFAKRTGRDYRLTEMRQGQEHVIIPWTPALEVSDIRTPQVLQVMSEDAFVTLSLDGRKLQQVRLDRKPLGSVGVYVDGPGLTIDFSDVLFGPRR